MVAQHRKVVHAFCNNVHIAKQNLEVRYKVIYNGATEFKQYDSEIYYRFNNQYQVRKK